MLNGKSKYEYVFNLILNVLNKYRKVLKRIIFIIIMIFF